MLTCTPVASCCFWEIFTIEKVKVETGVIDK